MRVSAFSVVNNETGNPLRPPAANFAPDRSLEYALILSNSGNTHPTRRNQRELYHVPPKPVKSGEGAAKKNAVAEHGENGGLEARSPYEGYKAVSLCPPCAPYAAKT